MEDIPCKASGGMRTSKSSFPFGEVPMSGKKRIFAKANRDVEPINRQETWQRKK